MAQLIGHKNIKRMEVVYQIVAACFAFLLLTCTWRVLSWAYFTPKKLEKYLREHGLKGNSYRLIYGDFKEMSKTIEQATSKPINFDDDIKLRVHAFILKIVQKYGMYAL